MRSDCWVVIGERLNDPCFFVGFLTVWIYHKSVWLKAHEVLKAVECFYLFDFQPVLAG